MFDPGLARRLAGTLFLRADTQRDERAEERARPVEDFLRNLRGWLPAARATRRQVARLVRLVDAAAAPLAALDDAAVAARFHAAVALLRIGRGDRADLAALPTVLACVCVACKRQLGMWPHAVQCAGARALLLGELAEMHTGEGKTLVAAMAATMMAGSGAAVHVLSTNDYLARRDRDEMAPLFRFFGLHSGVVQGGMPAELRRVAYAQPICYAAGKEVVFDYLKDRVAGHGALPARVSQLRAYLHPELAQAQPPLIPALHFAIVDEADSVMIDEARTPMILSREAPSVFPEPLMDWAMDAARGLVSGRDFRIGAARDVELRPGALGRTPPPPGDLGAQWQAPAWREHLLQQALAALHLYQRDQHYILSDGKVQIVDESTGRVMADRSWEQGLHQLIETKEGMPLTRGRETLARMTYQRFFRRYYLVAGLTGTAAEATRELWSVYRLRVRRIPPNRAKRRRHLPTRCLPDTAAKWQAVAASAGEVAARGQPVLVGTRSVEASEQVSAALAARGLAHVVLNARQDAEEAAIVAEAGQAGRITVATNMAGRGTDIRLDADARAAGGLHVLLTEFHESPRVDRQLFGRSARQGEPGTVQAIVSTEDRLLAHTPAWLRRLAAQPGPAGGLLLRCLVGLAQARAERRAYLGRLQTLRQDRERHRIIGFAGRVT